MMAVLSGSVSIVLPDPVQFLTHLKHKAGLAANHWSDRVEVYRYRTESFGEEDLA